MLDTIDQPALSLQPSPLLVSFVKRMIRNAQLHIGPERRIDGRQSIVLPVVVQPMDEHRLPLGPRQAMVTKNLSTWGIGLVHEEPISCDLIAVQMSVAGEEVLLEGQIRWRAPLGPYYMCGCKVLSKLDRLPAPLADDLRSHPAPCNAAFQEPLWNSPA